MDFYCCCETETTAFRQLQQLLGLNLHNAIRMSVCLAAKVMQKPSEGLARRSETGFLGQTGVRRYIVMQLDVLQLYVPSRPVEILHSIHHLPLYPTFHS